MKNEKKKLNVENSFANSDWCIGCLACAECVGVIVFAGLVFFGGE